MKPKYSSLRENHYSSDPANSNYLSAKEVYSEAGYDLDKLITQNSAYENTCAVRMSLALIKSNVAFRGRLKITSGSHKGKSIEPGAKLLADQLMKPHIFGKPKVYLPYDFLKKVKNKKGLVLFWKISGYGGGHIDLIEIINALTICNSNCYMQSKEIWFWELK